MKKNKFTRPKAFVEPTKDTRFPNTFEVLVPVEGRNKPHRVAQHFDTQKAAEDWIHSPDGVEIVNEILAKAARERS